MRACRPHIRRNVARHRSKSAPNVFDLLSTAHSTPSTSISGSLLLSPTAVSDLPTFPSNSATSFISTSPASSIALFFAYPTFFSTFLAFFLDSGAAFLIAWLVRGVGFVILFLARRWVCCRLLLRVRAVLGLREVGVLGLEREGIVGGGCCSMIVIQMQRLEYRFGEEEVVSVCKVFAGCLRVWW